MNLLCPICAQPLSREDRRWRSYDGRYARSSSGGGKYIAVLQFKKSVPSDEGRQRQAALLAFSAFAELKHVFLVDEDVDCFDMKDVLWAMTTRFQADKDLICIPGVQCHPLDPSNQPEYAAGIRARGVACKAGAKLELSGTELRLLAYFLEHPGRLLTKRQLLERIWDEEGNYVDENTLAVTIRRLRVKVEADPGHPERIRTVHGQGYRWQEMDR